MRRLAILIVFVILWCGTASATEKRLTLDQIAKSNTLLSAGVSDIQWKPDSSAVTFLRQQGTNPSSKVLCLYTVATGRESLLFDPSKQKGLTISSYSWSPRGDSILIVDQADLWLLRVADGELRRLTSDPETENSPGFAPSGDRVAFAKGSNLFDIDLSTGLTEQLTEETDKNAVNGDFDWVYNEELGLRNKEAFEWSPDSKWIVYLRLDQTPEREYPLVSFTPAHAELEMQRYPTPGDRNAVVSVHMVAVGQQDTRLRRDLEIDHSRFEYVVPAFSWSPDSRTAYFMTLNRPQDELTIHSFDTQGKHTELLTDKDPHWINVSAAPFFLKDGSFLLLSERDGWKHLYRYSADGKLISRLTSGNWMIDSESYTTPTLQADQKGGWIYFSAIPEKDPRERQVYRVQEDGGDPVAITRDPGTHGVYLSPDGRFCIETFSDIAHPTVTRLIRSDGSFVTTLDKPENHLPEYGTSKIDFVEVKAADGTTTLYASLAKPADFDPSRKYPVLLYVYGGPAYQMVRNAWQRDRAFWDLINQQGILVWSLDNRGSYGRGHAFETPIFKDTGRIELQDQLAGIAYLKSLPYVDGSRIGIYGWSYGGYLTLYSLTHAPTAFRCGISGAPVTDWTLYDTIYTERYMRTPADNPEGYRTASPLTAADKLQAKLLLIHGTSDDNVHMQNTMKFVDALIKAHIPYQLDVQPGQSHGFRGETARLRRDGVILDFLQKCLLESQTK